MLKLPAIVGLIVIVLSIPQITSIITSILPKRELITNNINMILPLVKGILASSLYFGISRTL